MKDSLEEFRNRPVRTPKQAEESAEAARLLADLLRLEDRVSRLIRPAEPAGDETSLEGMALHEAAELVLRRAGGPLHARELGERLYAAGWRHRRPPYRRPDQIVHQIAARLPKYPDVFRRSEPNVFALVEWGPRVPRRTGGKPRIPLFAGPGGAIGKMIGDNPDLVFTDERTGWRSS